MICFPNTKINIGLQVVEKRPDGFHNIRSVFYPISLCDMLEAVESKDFHFTSTGKDIPGHTEDNLCVKAYRLLSAEKPIPPVHIHLHKVTPMGAGLGGGSANAAFFIRLMNEKFALGMDDATIRTRAAKLGSDCPFFVSNEPAFVQGRGDVFEAIGLSLKGYHIALVCPPIHINTAEAYSGIVPRQPDVTLPEFILNNDPGKWKEELKNDFEPSVFQKYPAVREIKERLYSFGAAYASMSGSGSAVYGIFERKKDLSRKFQGYFIWQEELR